MVRRPPARYPVQPDKEYDFFAAIAGVRSRFNKPPLIPPRGDPPISVGPPASISGKVMATLPARYTCPRLSGAFVTSAFNRFT